MNWNRRKALPEWEKRRIRNRHEKYLRREKILAYILAFLVLAVITVGMFIDMYFIVGGV